MAKSQKPDLFEILMSMSTWELKAVCLAKALVRGRKSGQLRPAYPWDHTAPAIAHKDKSSLAEFGEALDDAGELELDEFINASQSLGLLVPVHTGPPQDAPNEVKVKYALHQAPSPSEAVVLMAYLITLEDGSDFAGFRSGRVKQRLNTDFSIHPSNVSGIIQSQLKRKTPFLSAVTTDDADADEHVYKLTAEGEAEAKRLARAA